MFGSPSRFQPQGKHWGWDVWGPTGTPLYFLTDGEIILSREGDGGSKFWQWFIVEYEDGICQLHGHLKRGTIPKLGKVVRRGQKAGEIGTLKDALDSVPHSHTQFFESRKDALGIPGTHVRSLDPLAVRKRYGETLAVRRAPGWASAQSDETDLYDIPCGC